MRIIKGFLLVVLLLFSFISIGQKKEDVLLTINDENVYASEFIRVFQKNKDIVVDYDKKNFKDYFDLFVDFKIKLKEAYDLNLDTISTYQKELAKYKEILIKPYLQDTSAIESLVEEAYQRSVLEVDASHILIKVATDANPKDTLEAYNRILEGRNKILKGMSFEQVAKEYSEDPSVQVNGGNLGYFSVFSMVYPFENAVFETSVGDVSMPFRTQFGYHIVKVVDKRKSVGEIQVAHIMVKNNPEDSTYAKTQIFEIYNKLNEGGDFSQIAKEHSDDASTAAKGGIMPKFGSGRMLPVFDEVAFDLVNESDYSEPFQTNFGWHILKLVKKFPVKSYDEQYANLKSRIEKGSRSKYIKSALAERLEVHYEIVENFPLLQSFYNNELSRMKSNEVLLSVNDEKTRAIEFYNYRIGKEKITTDDLYKEFKTDKIISYYKNNLEFTNDEFAATYNEYKDGLLLFELLQQKIWDRSERDSIGLLEYYDSHKNNYRWRVRGELSIASCTSLEKAEQVKKYLEKDYSIEKIKDKLNDGATIHVLFSSGELEEGSSKLPANFVMKEGVSDIFNERKNQYTIIDVKKVKPSSLKALNETRGEVVNDYQNYLEKEWVKELRETYEIEVNQSTYDKLKDKYGKL